jgi:hypothetical protein
MLKTTNLRHIFLFQCYIGVTIPPHVLYRGGFVPDG